MASLQIGEEKHQPIICDLISIEQKCRELRKPSRTYVSVANTVVDKFHPGICDLVI